MACPLCAILWRMLTWCSRKQVTLKARQIPGQLNVVAGKLSRLGQTIQTVVSPLTGFPINMQQVASTSDRPFATRLNNKLTPLAWALDALSLPWEDLDPYGFPPVAILGKLVPKLQDCPCSCSIRPLTGTCQT